MCEHLIQDEIRPILARKIEKCCVYVIYCIQPCLIDKERRKDYPVLLPTLKKDSNFYTMFSRKGKPLHLFALHNVLIALKFPSLINNH